MSKPKWAPVVASAIAAALLAAGCGSSDDTTTASAAGGSGGATSADAGDAEGVQAGTGATAEAAAKAGEEAGNAAGKATLPRDKTVGFLRYVAAAEADQRVTNTARQALALQGVKMIACDGAGSTTKMIACGNSLLSRGVDAILQDGADLSTIQPVADAAKKAGVPMIEVSGLVGPGYDAAYYPDEAKAGKVLADSLMEKLGELPGDSVSISVADFPVPWATTRTDELKKLIDAQDKVKIVAKSMTDPANLIEGTKKTMTDQLTANPDIKAIWVAYDAAGQAAGLAMEQAFPGKEFPDKPWVVTFHADKGTQALMRRGAVNEVLDVNYDASSWTAADQLFQLWARETPLSDDPSPDYPGVGDLYTYQSITKDNLPEEGQYPDADVDVPAYFEAKWKAEFGSPQE